MTQLEYTYFRPDTPKNEEFFLSVMKWPEDVQMLWAIVKVPRAYEKAARELLWQHGLKVGGENDPGQEYTFIVIGPEGPQKFPLEGENVFCLENHSKGAGHVAYTNDPEKINAAEEAEKEICKRFRDEHEEWLAIPENYAAAKAYWDSRPDIYPPEQPDPPAPETRRF
jgi:hypothetical protein